MGYLATQILAMAVVLQGVLLDANVFPEVSLRMTVVISTAILVFYSVTGGIVASVYTDLIQGHNHACGSRASLRHCPRHI